MTQIDVTLSGSPVATADLTLGPGINLTNGERQFSDYFGAPTSLETDLLTVVGAIYCADLAIKRGQRENITRSVRLKIPVTNLASFRGVRDQLIHALHLLSHDAWDISFSQRDGTPEPTRVWREEHAGKVLLFSGGLDSLAGAIMYGEGGEAVGLISHVTANRVVSGAQDQLEAYLERAFPGNFTRYSFRVGGINRAQRGFPFPSDDDREDSQRTRSFMFLALASLVARRLGVRDVVVIAENGQMAIHLPLSVARIGAFSTHTAHPAFLDTAASLFSVLLGHDIRISNPFLYHTKAEAISRTVAAHQTALELSVSCWRASRVRGPQRHCGSCVPCLIRRIAVEFNGHQLAEYQRDLLAEDVSRLGPDDDGKRNLVELAEFIHTFAIARSQAELEDLYPDLINPHFDRVRAVEMYRRFATEGRTVLDGYASVRPLFA